MDGNQIVERTFHTIDSKDDGEGYELSVLSWNILCQKFATGFPKVPDEYLTWEYRFPLIKQQLISKTKVYDIILLQEVDKYEEISEFLKEYGYQGFLGMRGDNVMGCAIFWLHARFEVVQDFDRRFFGKDIRYTYSLGKLQDTQSQKVFLLSTLHLKASQAYQDLRKEQAQELLSDLNKEQDENVDFTIVGGDFNEIPENRAVQMMKKEYKSAFQELNNGEEPEFTSYQFRDDSGAVKTFIKNVFFNSESETGYIKRTIDYVFYQEGKLRPTGYLRIPDKENINWEMANPCKNHPSDHYAIGFSFKLI